ncbi:F-box only protein 7-like [Uloborus diversus]|uniref:F-box only protein 7-like n=1 Tax=Uloborus diversus TaxID=327109 RepID=UPI00240938DF|nr:F-box only protein 7-like [Uloborus diversus]
MTESTEKLFEEKDLSKNISHLVQQTKIENASDALTVLLHGFMIETGYIPSDIDESEKYDHMPKQWMKNGVYKIRYFYKNFPQLYCWMTCIPMYNNLSIFSAIDSPQCEADTQITLNIDRYVKYSQEFSSPSTSFSNLNNLSRHFKDEFCFPLLKLLHETLGISISFGFDGLLEDLKLHILELLPVESIVSCSAVNKKFNELANSPYLWKNLYLRDFELNGIPDIPSTSQDGNEWKKAYKRQYLRRKKLSEPHFPVVYPYPMHIYPIAPDLRIDPQIDFDFPIYDAFPHLRRQLQPPFFHPGFPSTRHLFRRYW